MIQRHKCYGSATIGERGQIVIPAEARQELALEPGDKLLVFGRSGRGMLVIIKADRVAELVTRTTEWLGQLKETMGEGETGADE